MRSHYYRIEWINAAGAAQLSDPITRWTDAELFRRELLRDLPDCAAHILHY